MSRFMSHRFDSLEEYVPGEQPQDRKYIKLNTNESPFPPSPRTLAAIEGARPLNLYPDISCTDLTEALAKRYGVGKRNVILTNGSDDLLNFSFMAFCDADNGVIFPEVSYGFYEVYANLYNIPYKKIPMNPDFSIDTGKYCNAGCTVVIANPNAQTGIALPLSDIEEIVKTNPDHAVVVDEAYVDFGGESAVSLIDRYDNVIVIQTYSKSRSMAGARLGFAIGSETIISDINKIKFSTNPYNINTLTQVIGKAAIEDDDYYMNNAREIAEVRDKFSSELRDLGYLVLPSKANFVLARSGKLSGEEVYTQLRNRGILVRHFSDPQISDFVRISIGTAQQMNAVYEAVKEMEK